MTDNENFETKNEVSETQNNNNNESVSQQAEQNSVTSDTDDGSNNSNNKNDGETYYMQRLIRKNIAKTLSDYDENKHKIGNIKQYNMHESANEFDNRGSYIVSFLKVLLILFLLLIISSAVITFIVMPKVNNEESKLITQINNAEKEYHTIHNKYHYFSKTAYDSQLGVNMKTYKYFNYYEVMKSNAGYDYEIKLYGTTNVFTITYHTIKAFLKKKF